MKIQTIELWAVIKESKINLRMSGVYGDSRKISTVANDQHYYFHVDEAP